MFTGNRSRTTALTECVKSKTATPPTPPTGKPHGTNKACQFNAVTASEMDRVAVVERATYPDWWRDTSASFSRTTTRLFGNRPRISLAVASPTIPPPTMATSYTSAPTAPAPPPPPAVLPATAAPAAAAMNRRGTEFDLVASRTRRRSAVAIVATCTLNQPPSAKKKSKKTAKNQQNKNKNLC
jgi:hypothetical protein